MDGWMIYGDSASPVGEHFATVAGNVVHSQLETLIRPWLEMGSLCLDWMVRKKVKV